MAKSSEKKPPSSGGIKDRTQSKLDSFFHCSPALTRVSSSPKRSSPRSTKSASSGGNKSVENNPTRAGESKTNKVEVVTQTAPRSSPVKFRAQPSSTTVPRPSLDKEGNQSDIHINSTSTTNKSATSKDTMKGTPDGNTKSTKIHPSSRSPLRRLSNKGSTTKRPRDQKTTNDEKPVQKNPRPDSSDPSLPSKSVSLSAPNNDKAKHTTNDKSPANNNNSEAKPAQEAESILIAEDGPLGIAQKMGLEVDTSSSVPLISRMLPKYSVSDNNSSSIMPSQETSHRIMTPSPQSCISKPLKPLDHVAVFRKPRNNERDKFGRLKIPKWESGIVQKVTAIKGKPFAERNKVKVLLESSSTCTVEWSCDEKSLIQRWIPDGHGSEHLEMLPSVKTTPAPQDLEIGDAVLALFQRGRAQGCDPDLLFPGRVAQIKGDRCSVAYDDGDWEDNIPYQQTHPKTVLIRFSKGHEEPEWMIGMRVIRLSNHIPRKKIATVEKVEPGHSVWLKYQGLDKPEKVAYHTVVQSIMTEASAKADRNKVCWPDTTSSPKTQSVDLDSPAETSSGSLCEMGSESTSGSAMTSTLNSSIETIDSNTLNQTFMSLETGVVSNDSSYRLSLHSAASEDTILETPPQRRRSRRKREAEAIVRVSSMEDTNKAVGKPSIKEYKTTVKSTAQTVDLTYNSSDCEIIESPAKKQKRTKKRNTRHTSKKLQNPEKSKVAPPERSDSDVHENIFVAEKECVPEEEMEETFKWKWPASYYVETLSPVPTGQKPSSRHTTFSVSFSSSIQRALKSTDTQLAFDYLSHSQSHHGLKPNDNLKSFVDELILKGPQSGASSRIAYPDCQKMDLASEVAKKVDVSWNDFWDQMSSDLYTVKGDDRRMNKYALQRIAASAHAKSVTAEVFLRQNKEDYPSTPLKWLGEIRTTKGPREAFQSALNTVVSLWKSYSHFYFASNWDIEEVCPDSRVFVQRNTRELLQYLGQVLSFAGQVYGMDETNDVGDLAYFISSRIETSLHSFALPKELRGELELVEYKRKMMMQIVLDLDQKVIPGVRPLVASQLGLALEYNFLFSLDYLDLVC